VVHGRGRGRAFGFPSANVSAETECLPPNGVYACRAIFRDASYPAIVSIGPRPTFDDDEKAVEAHIIGFDGDLYGARIKLEVVELLRAQQKFDSPALLARQIERDIIRVGQVLEKY
jgi:riboflavin kinase/FMN adenylyltransferase